jgi:hypothetical protein
MNTTRGIALLSITAGPKTLDDAQRLARGLAHLLAEDPALRATTDQVTGEVVIAGPRTTAQTTKYRHRTARTRRSPFGDVSEAWRSKRGYVFPTRRA